MQNDKCGRNWLKVDGLQSKPCYQITSHRAPAGTVTLFVKNGVKLIINLRKKLARGITVISLTTRFLCSDIYVCLLVCMAYLCLLIGSLDLGFVY